MVIDDRIEIMELVTSIIGSKAPRDSAALRIAFGLQCGNALAQLLHAFHPTRQTATGKNTDLDLGHVQPTAMFGSVMELHPLQNAAGLSRFKGFIQGSSRMRIQVILHNANVFRLRIDRIHQPADAVGIVDLGAMLGHLHMAPARQRFDEEKQIGGAQSLILVIDALDLSWLQWHWGPHVGLWGHELFVKADAGIARIVLFFIEIQHILHRSDKLRSYGWNAPLFMLPGLEFVFLSNWRMVSGEIDSTKPSSTAFPASKRTVQWSWPPGAGLHATAIRWAACPPLKAWRYRFCRLSCSTASNPPSRYTCRTRMEVLRLMSKAAQISWSVQPSAALSKTRARVKVRALALPAWMNVCNEARSLSESVTGMGCFIGDSLFFHHHLIPVNIQLD